MKYPVFHGFLTIAECVIFTIIDTLYPAVTLYHGTSAEAAGNPNAHSVTSYGLKNGYTSIKWWREDTGWWEYCLLDWQNKYNESWRIRPISVMNLNSHFFKRISGGTRHWLFDRMIIRDLKTSIFG